MKDAGLERALGTMLAGMIGELSERGPDSAGFALYGAPDTGATKITVRLNAGDVAGEVAARLGGALEDDVLVRSYGSHSVFTVPEEERDRARAFLDAEGRLVVGEGRRMMLFKAVGLPRDVARHFDLAGMAGTHAIAHTRMATESAVTTDGAHPFSTGADQCLVHNGSLSNHNAVRRVLMREGLAFRTENDSEVAAGYLTYRMRQGLSLGAALEASLEDLDGFFTFVVGTETGFGVLRDPIACKPAVMAETDRFVAFGSEYRALAGLPGIDNARVFEPEPGTVYFWERT